MIRRRKRRQSLYSRRRNKNPISLILFLCVIGFLIWVVLQVFVLLFSNIRSESSSAEIKILKGRAEFLLPETQDWSLAFSEQRLWPEETIKISSNGKASLEIFENNILFLGPDTELKVLELEENSSNKKTVKLQLKKGNVWVRASGDDFKDENSIFQIETDRSSLKVNGTIFDLENKNQQDILRLVKGSLDLSILGENEKDTSSIISMGVGQKIIIDSAAKAKVDNGEDLLTAIDPKFLESDWHIKNLKIFFPLEASEIQQRIKKNEIPNTSTPIDVLPTEGSSEIESPKIISPKDGIKIPASEDMIKIEGTASLDTFQIEVNGFSLTKFNPGDKKWTYFAAPKFGTLISGENKFSIVAVSRDGKKSLPTVLNVFYEGKTSVIPVKQNPETTVPEKKEVNTFPAPLATSPKLFNTEGIHETASSIITIRGTADKRTSSIEINGFRLRKFKEGNTDFSYIANAAYGNMKKGLNNYHIVARGANGKFSETTIKIKYTPVDI